MCTTVESARGKSTCKVQAPVSRPNLSLVNYSAYNKFRFKRCTAAAVGLSGITGFYHSMKDFGYNKTWSTAQSLTVPITIFNL